MILETKELGLLTLHNKISFGETTNHIGFELNIRENILRYNLIIPNGSVGGPIHVICIPF